MNWTLKLRPNVEFTDNTPLNADAVKANWLRYADPANKSPAQATAATIATMNVTDPTTLKITLKAPNGQFPRAVAGLLGYIVSPTALQQMGPTAFASKPVGAGPFIVQTWVRGASLTLIRNPNYWDKGKPYLDKLVILPLTDATQRYNALEGNSAQMLFTGSALDQAARAKSSGFKVIPIKNLVGGTYFVFNMSKEPFNDITARQAIAYALNTKRVDQTVFQGVDAVPNTLAQPGSPFYNSKYKWPAFNPKKAQSLIEQYKQTHGKPLEFTVTTTVNSQPVIDAYLAQLTQFQDLITHEDVVLSSAIVPLEVAGNYQLGTFGFGGNDFEPGLHDRYITGGSLNIQKYSNAAIDQALDQGRSTLVTADRKKAYDTVQQLILQDLTLTWAAPADQFLISQKDIKGIKIITATPQLEQLWLSGKG